MEVFHELKKLIFTENLPCISHNYFIISHVLYNTMLLIKTDTGND